MSDTAREVFAFLESLNIPLRTAEHPPAFTMADCAALDAALVRIAVDAALAKRMVEAGRVAAESYDWRKLAAKILKFYEEM